MGSWLDRVPGVGVFCHANLVEQRRAHRTHHHPLLLLERSRNISHLLFCGIGLMSFLNFSVIFKQRKRKILKDILSVPLDFPLLFNGKKKGIGNRGIRERNHAPLVHNLHCLHPRQACPPLCNA